MKLVLTSLVLKSFHDHNNFTIFLICISIYTRTLKKKNCKLQRNKCNFFLEREEQVQVDIQI